MKKVIGLIAMLALFVNCGGSDSEVVPTVEDKVIAVSDSFQVDENNVTVLPSFLANDTYKSGNIKITFEEKTEKGGTVSLSNNIFTYTPKTNFSGTDSFKYTICSTITTSSCSRAIITLKVIDAGSPVAVDDSYETYKNNGLIISDFLDNDTVVDNTEFHHIDASNSLGRVSITNNGSLRYIPKTDFIGQDSFTYTICDNDNPSTCSTATITVTIKSPGGNSGSFNIPSELVDYYKNVDFTLTGSSLKDALATTIINTHSTNLSYSPGVWNALKQSDLDPTNSSKVVLIYGYNDSDGNYITDRTRDKDANGATAGTQWNREHVYPKSLGNPNLGESGPGADAHHLRPSDVTFNNQRSNKKFATGSGNAGDVSGNWFPGEEWKGDVARMMMYMYLRYGNQCLPKNVAVGSAASSDSNMVTLLLQWNADDPVSDLEKQRNNVIANKQGNRNPFIDNPYLATVIWNGEAAQNTWK